MKIVSWNCHGAFRKKYSVVQSLNADIYVIQECENPQKYEGAFSEIGFRNPFFWCGENDNKGLGVFAVHDISLQENQWKKYCLRNFISLKVNHSFDLLCVWACLPYIEEYYIYQTVNFEHYNEDMLIIGDFNSNVRWDKQHNRRNHTAVVNRLGEIGLVSAYHHISGEKQGNESLNTYYLHFNRKKGYHIDHCFVSSAKLERFSVLEANDWLSYSDHIPIVVEIKG